MSINLTADDLAKLLAAIQQPIVKEAIDGAKPVKSEPDSTSDSGSKWLVSDVESKIRSLEGLLEAKSSETSLLESKVRDLASEVETKSTETFTLDSKVRELKEKFVEASNAKEQLRSDLLQATSNLETRLVDLEQNLEGLQTKFEQDGGKKVLVEQIAALETTLDSKFRNLEKQLTIRSMKRTSALESKANIQDRKLNELQLLFISLLLFMFLLLLIAIVWQVLKGYFIGY